MQEKPYPVLDAVTEGGSVYRLDLERGFWRKHSRHGWTDPIERILTMQASEKFVRPWVDPEAWTDVTRPVLGQHMHIASRDVWWITLQVVRLVETTSDAPWSTLE